MSETVSEDPTGVVEDSGQDADESAEDQEAQDLLDQMTDDDPEKLRQQIAHWKKQSRTHERAANKNSAAAAKLQQIEEGQKSELQKATEAREAAERERDAAHEQTNRMLAAAAHDLPTELIDFLGGGSAEEISERAEQLSSIIKAEVDKRVGSSGNGGRRPAGQRTVSAMRPGAAPAGTGPGNMDQMFRQLIHGDSD